MVVLFLLMLFILVVVENYSRCKMLQYCSKECQKEHWILVHKSQCKKLAEKSEGAVGEDLNANGSHLENLLILLGKTLDKIKHTAMWSDSEVRTQLMQLEQDIRDSKELTKGFRIRVSQKTKSPNFGTQLTPVVFIV